MGYQSLGIPIFMNLHSLTFEQLQELNTELKECLNADLRTCVQKIQMVINYYEDFNELPDKEFIAEANKSLNQIIKYINWNMM